MKKLARGVAALSATLIAAAGPIVAAFGQDDAAEAWRARLTAEDLDVREEAFDACVDALADDAALQGTVRAWSEGTGELAWTARLLLRDLDLRRAPASPFGLGRAPGLDPFGPDLDRLFEDLGLGLDPFAHGLRGPQGLGGLGAGPLGHGLDPRAFGGSSSARSFSLQETPDGVRVEIVEEENGDERTKTYEAESLDELLEQHPELRDRIGVGPGVGLPRSFSFGLGGRDPFHGLAGPLGRAPLVRTDRLGVLVSAPDEGVEGALAIERVFPGSLAAALGLAPGDELAELCGAAVSSPEDVARALAARADGEPVTAAVRRDGAALQLSWTPPAAAPERLLFDGPTRRL